MRTLPLLALFFAVLSTSLVKAQPVFTNVASSAGIDYIQYGGSGLEPRDQQPVMSGGAAAGDFDNDGWVDLYVTRQDAPGILYRNKGNGTFEDVTIAAFGPNHMGTPLARGNGAAWGDIDNDGDLDLYVTTVYFGRHFLFINDGEGRFTEDAIARNAAVIDANQIVSYGFSSTFGDYDSDGYLDIHVTEWRLTNQMAGNEFENQFLQHNTRLLKNRGASSPGRFDDVTDVAGVAVEQVPSQGEELTNSEAFASRFSDIDRDGHPDLLIASDHHTSRLFWNNGDGTFTDGTVAAGVGTENNGMGSALGDYDGDGDLDWFVTSIYSEEQRDSTDPLARNGNRLFRYDGGRLFTDVTDAAGVRDGQWGWGAAFLDFDNDGDLDLAMTNGMDHPLGSFDAGYEDDKSVFWENNGSGVYTNVSDNVGFNDRFSGKGLLTFDYDKDGDLDVFIVNNSARPLLYRNDGGNESNWLRIKLSGTRSNSQAIGAFVTLTPDLTKPNEIRVHEVNAGSHYLGQSETTLHFGLADFETVDEVKIDWPDGAATYHEGLGANQTLEFVQPSSVSLSRSVEVQELVKGESFELQLNASMDGATFSATGLPDGLDITANGLISGQLAEWGSFSSTIAIQHPSGDGEVALNIVVFTTYENWTSEHFSEAGEEVLEISGPDVDFDQDGRSNFQEYVSQTNPKEPDAGSLLTAKVLSLNGREYLSVTYREFIYANDLVQKVAVNWSLLQWFDNETTIVELDRKLISNGMEEVTVYSNSALLGTGDFFMRVESEKSGE